MILPTKNRRDGKGPELSRAAKGTAAAGKSASGDALVQARVSEHLFPVIRIGRLALASDGGETRTFSYEEGRAIITEISKRSNEFAVAVTEALYNRLAAAGAKPQSAPENLFGQLAPARQSPSLGAVFDFQELAIEVGDMIGLVRPCATLCVAEPRFGFSTRKSTAVHSKLWIRVIFAAQRRNGDWRPATNVSDAEVREFYAMFSPAAQDAAAAMQAPYEKCIRKSMSSKTLTVSLKEAFNVLTVGTNNPDFERLFALSQSGRSLIAAKDENTAAKDLLHLANAIIAGQDAGGRTQRIDLKQDEVQFLRLEDDMFNRGLFLAQFDADAAHFVGLAATPMSAATEGDLFRSVSEQPSNVVSAVLISEYGVRH